MGGLIGRDAVKRHQRGRPAWGADDLRAPSIGPDLGHLDEICAAIDSFLEVQEAVQGVVIVTAVNIATSERKYEAHRSSAIAPAN